MRNKLNASGGFLVVSDDRENFKTVTCTSSNRVPNGYERCSCCYQIFDSLGSVVSRPIVIKLFTHIDDNILHQATVADF